MFDFQSSNVHFNQFASQIEWSFLSHFYNEKQKILRNVIIKIKKDFSQLKFTKKKFVQWSSNINVVFEK